MSGLWMPLDDLWFACTEPERPTDPYVAWHYRGCVGCQVKAQSLARLHPEDSHVAWLNDRMTSEQETG